MLLVRYRLRGEWYWCRHAY